MDPFSVPDVIPTPARYCADRACSKKLAAMNRGKYCFTCSEKRHRIAAARDGMVSSAPVTVSAKRHSVKLLATPRRPVRAVHNPLILDRQTLQSMVGSQAYLARTTYPVIAGTIRPKDAGTVRP